MNKIRKFIEVQGVVQGVGFRPFVYNLATKYNLKGWVNNTSSGVLIDVEGSNIEINYFIEEIKNNPPPLSNVNCINIMKMDIVNYREFLIKNSKSTINATTYISPDYCVCDECIREIFDIKNRRYRYPFTNCTNCGPRFTIIKGLPYDRKVTTMAEFDMCSSCIEEYNNPLNRRFHAQPNACHKCGPIIFLLNNNGKKIKCKDAIIETANLLKENKIVAIKGIGGFNLACNAKSEEAIELLRRRKRRPRKPLAVMMKDIFTVKRYCNISLEEERLLTSNKRPILLLNKKNDYKLPQNLSPNNKKIGVMLPYTPMHYLLFEDNIEALVMTSANISGEPMIYKNDEAIRKLNNIADYYLMNNREIYIPIDDSVSSVIYNSEKTIRLGRGYAPMALSIKTKQAILALGSELKNTFSLSNKNDIFISEYIGDLKEINTLNNLENCLKHFIKIYEVDPKVIAVDLHPNFICKELDIYQKYKCNNIIKVQHHHAHIVSCMVDNSLDNKVIGIAFDGTGYGYDNKIWGGEFIICDKKSFNRVGQLEYFKLAGGESAIKEPWKIAISLIYKVYNDDFIKYMPSDLIDKDYNVIKKMINKNINCPETSSMGRLFDAISSILGFDKMVSFEGEAAIYLENICDEFVHDYFDYFIKINNDRYELCFDNTIKGILEDLNNKVDKSVIAKKFHNTIIRSSVDLAVLLREKFNINIICLSGGVFQNEILLSGISKELKSRGFKVFTHKNIPCNDSGISLGQLIIANENI